MKIGIISDIHENFHNLILALNQLKEHGVEQIFCLGDLMNAGIAKILSIQDVPVFLIWGNNDEHTARDVFSFFPYKPAPSRRRFVFPSSPLHLWIQ